MLQNHLKAKIDYGQLQTKYMKIEFFQYLVATMVPYFFSFFINMPVFLLPYVYRIYNAFLLITCLFIRLRIFQVILIVGVLKENLRQINLSLQAHAKHLTELRKRIQIRPHRPYTIGDELMYCQQVYAEMCLIPKYLSDCFGWSLVIIVLHVMYDITTAFYWTFVNFHSFKLNLNATLST